MNDLTDFEKVYNRVYRDINSWEELLSAAIKFERDRCAKILNDWAKLCAKAADQSNDERFKIAMLTLASDLSVIEQEIIEG